MSRVHRLRIVAHVLLGFALLLLGIVPQAVSHAAKPTRVVPKASLDVVLVIDSGVRNYGNALQTSARALNAYVRNFPSNVRFGLVTFSGPATETQAFTVSKEKIQIALSQQSASGDSNLLDGIAFAQQKFELGYTVKRQIVVATDGFDSGSLTKMDVLVKQLQASGTRVDVLTFDSPDAVTTRYETLTKSTGGLAIPTTDLKALGSLAQRTVAWATPPPPPQAPELNVFNRILRSKLALGLGMALVFGGLMVVTMMLTAPKPKKVSLMGARGEMDSSKPNGAISGLADRLANVADKALEGKPQKKDKGLNVLLERAAINLRPGEFVVIQFAASLVGAAIGFLSGQWIGMGVGFLLAGFVLPRKYLKRKIKKRSIAFGEQLSDTLQLLSSSLRAGQGLMQAVDSVAKEGEAPASEEFRRVLVEARLGRDLIDSLKSMSERLQSEDFNWVIPAIEINREVGGDLAEVLDTVASTVRDRADIRRQVKTLSAEGRMSAYVLLALPIGIGILVRSTNPKYMGELFHGFGWVLTGIGSTMLIIGGFWLFSLCKIEF